MLLFKLIIKDIIILNILKINVIITNINFTIRKLKDLVSYIFSIHFAILTAFNY